MRGKRGVEIGASIEFPARAAVVKVFLVFLLGSRKWNKPCYHHLYAERGVGNTQGALIAPNPCCVLKEEGGGRELIMVAPGAEVCCSVLLEGPRGLFPEQLFHLGQKAKHK